MKAFFLHNFQTSPNSQLGTRVPAQDYEKLRRQCLAQNKLFEDPYFPADGSSLFYSTQLPFTPEWKRPGVSCRTVCELYYIGNVCYDLGSSTDCGSFKVIVL